MAWWLLPPIWKIHAVFNPVHISVVEYIIDFQGYKPSRMPFFDVFSAAIYLPLRDLLWHKALGLFTLITACISLPIFYLASRHLFDNDTALFSLILFAFYPKILYLTGRAMPEAVSVSFLMVLLLGVAYGQTSGRLRWFGIAGIAATLAYMMFVPAVLVGILVAIYLYGDQIRTAASKKDFVPNGDFWTFCLPPGVVGVLYLLYGPIETIVSTGGINKVSLFTSGPYGFVERVVRYVGYTYFDFWWHTRGFDQESGILPTIQSLTEFLGPFAPIYFTGWIVITGTMSALILYGLYRALTRLNPNRALVVAVVLLFVVSFHYRNSGWAGAFQTRHVFPVFPFVCLAFGLGAMSIRDCFDAVHFSKLLVKTRDALPENAVSVVFLSLLFAVLIINGGVQGAIMNQKYSEARGEPTAELRDMVDEDESVGVIRNRMYHDTLIYTNGDIRPTILYDNDTKPSGKFTTDLATYQRVNASDPESFGVTYLYFRVQHEYLNRTLYHVDADQAFVERVLKHGTVKYRQRIESGSFRTTDIDVFIVRLE